VVDRAVDDDATGVAAGRKGQITAAHQYGSVPLRGSAVSEINIRCIREVPQNARRHASWKTVSSVTHLALVGHCRSICADGSASMDIDQNGLTSAIVAKLEIMGAAQIIANLLGENVKDLDF